MAFASKIIQLAREIGAHTVTRETYARALRIFGERDLVDLVGVLAQHAEEDTLLTVFDQQLPAGQKPLLPAS